jgi:hypothetical protein
MCYHTSTQLSLDGLASKQPHPASILNSMRSNKCLRRPDWGTPLPVRGNVLEAAQLACCWLSNWTQCPVWLLPKEKNHYVVFPVAQSRPCCDHTWQSKWHLSVQIVKSRICNNLLCSLFIEYYRSISMYDIRNALTEKSLPLSDNIHGLYKMMHPELLHTSGSGLIMYMFESLRDQIGSGKDRDYISEQHIQISSLIKRHSEQDFPRGSMRNGLIDGAKCQSSKQKGNLFRLLCIAHTTNGSCVPHKRG